MPRTDRVSWAVAIVLVDLVAVFVPLAAVFAAYVLVARPPWFKSWVLAVYSDPA